ncbi:MAG: UDP-glucose 4-epimerase GalE [Candidatus Absconditabacterales bacterium]
MNILVTGGAGYIGSHTVKLLLEQGLVPIVFDSLENGFKEFVLSEKFYQGDLRNLDDLERVFSSEHIDAVIHFAAYASVPDSVVNPDKYYHNNLIGGLNLLNTMNKYGVKKIIFSSSASVYGEPISEIIKENHPKQPINPYGHSKLVFEEILKWYNVAYQISSISFRYFCAAGASKDGIVGELHNPETHVIPVAILAALGKKEKFMIFGDDYPTPDGTGIRDFIHVEDLAQAHILGLSHLDENICKQFNLGIGKGFSVKEVTEAVKKISGKDFKVEIGPRRLGDPSILIADSHAAQSFLNWKPKYIDLEDMVQTSFNFLSKHYAD